MTVQLQHVSAAVAIERMWIYARKMSAGELSTATATVLAGKPVVYDAYSADGAYLGTTHILAETSPPVATVTETDL